VDGPLFIGIDTHELLDLPLFDSETLSDVPHNARHDAIALRDYVLAHEG
jgi:hypothetical protein